MRPQHNAAENVFARSVSSMAMEASMRPQHNAAENKLGPTVGLTDDYGFNEAAA